MAKRKAAAVHPMIAAVLAELPARGASDFGVAQRASWLRLMASTFDVVYGPSAPIQITGGIAAGVRPVFVEGELTADPNVVRPQVSKDPPPRFFIDRDGYARREPGNVRVVPEHVNDVIFDERG